MGVNVEHAYQFCEGMIQSHSSSFYHAFSQLPERERNAVFAVYGFCRSIDDFVDDDSVPLEQRFAQFASFSAHLERAMRGEWSQREPMWVALADVFRRYQMDFSAFLDMMEGQWFDLHFQPFESYQELERYCYLVAGSVGVMLLPILSPTSDHYMRQEAARLGIGMQLSNILRDVREDFERDRIYIPNQLFHQFPGAKDAIVQNRVNDDWRLLAAYLVFKARQAYEMGTKSYHRYPLRSQLPLLASSTIYQAILDEIEARDYDVFTSRIFVTDQRKAQLLCELQLRLEAPLTMAQGANG